MTDRYFDWYNGSDSNNGLSPATAKQSYDAYAQGAMNPGDRFLFKRGSPQIITTANTGAKVGSSDTARSVYGAYGEAQVPYAFVYNPSGVGNMILNVSGRSYIDFEDLYFDGLDVCQYSLYTFASGATACVGHRISRCYFTRMKSGEAGLVVGGTATSTGDVSDFLVEDSHFFGNPGHGMLVNGANGIRIRRNKFYWNGADAQFGAHGFSAKARRTDATSGWTNTSGTIWQRNLVAYETAVYYVKSSLSPYQRLNLAAGTQTAPGLGEYGVSSGVLYVNIGTNPTSQGINYAWGRCYNLELEDNESWGNVADPRSPSTEGHGFAFDDYTELSVLRGNLSHGNAGAGYSVNRGDNNTLESNIAYLNGLSGIVGAACKNTKIQHNTLFDNNRGPNPFNGEIVAFTYADLDITNNILKRGSARRRYAVDVDSTCTLSGDTNCAHGYEQIERGSNLLGTITDDPLLDDDFRPRAPSLIRAGSFVGGRDFNGKTRYNPPNIGAVEDLSATQRKVLARTA
jgi:parallel beta-helix repeat protein